MKRYADYIFEGLDTKQYVEMYKTVSSDLEKFWSDLEEKLDSFGDTNDRSANDVLEFNKNKRLERKNANQSVTPTSGATTAATTIYNDPQLVAPRKEYIYNYKTNAGDSETVEIVEPDNGTNTQTAIVRNVNKQGDQGKHPAKWSNLKITKQKRSTT